MSDGVVMVESVKKIYVVFVDETSIWWLRFLKKGFRHCYILFGFDDDMTWIEINPMSNQIFMNVYKFIEKVDFAELVQKEYGALICEVEVVNAGLKKAPFSWFSCVEMVKRIAGIHDKTVITPHQLYKKLKIVGKKS